MLSINYSINQLFSHLSQFDENLLRFVISKSGERPGMANGTGISGLGLRLILLERLELGEISLGLAVLSHAHPCERLPWNRHGICASVKIIKWNNGWRYSNIYGISAKKWLMQSDIYRL